MKKRVVAILLSLTLCLAAGAEAGYAADAGDFTSEAAAIVMDEVSVQTVSEEPEETVNPVETESAEAETVETETTVVVDSGDTEITPEEEQSADQEVVEEDSVPAETEVIFDDGSSADAVTETEASAVKNEAADAGGESFESFEGDNKLMYTRWENTTTDKDPAKWCLKKYQSSAASAAAGAGTTAEEEDLTENEADGSAELMSGTEETAVEAAAENTDEAAADAVQITEEESEAAALSSEDASEEDSVQTESEPQSETGAQAEPAVQEETQETAGSVDATKYYTDEDGIVTLTILDTSGKTVRTGSYLFDANGYMVVGSYTVGGATYYFEPAKSATIDRADLTPGDATTVTPVNSDLGTMKKSTWVWDGSKFSWYGTDGKKASSITEGIHEIDGNTYYLKASGVPFVGGKSNLTYNGKTGTYYFQPKSDDDDIPGKMAKSKWCLITSNGVKYYRYFNANGQYVKKAAGAYKIEGKTYLLRASGALVINKPLTTASGAQYFSDKNGVIRCSQLVSYNGYKYYYGSNGKRVSWKNCWKRIASKDNDYYYFGSVSGRVQVKTGWQKITVSGKYKGWYYFTSSGKMWKSRWNSKKTYYFCSDGHLASGLTKISGKYYYFQKSTSSKRRGTLYKSAWIQDTVNGKTVTYRASSSGQLVKTGWYKTKGNYYYLKNYKLVTSKTGLYNTKTKEWGAVDSQGKFGNGWMVINDSKNKVTYVSKTDGKIPKNKVVTIDGKQYRFDSKGYRVNDRTSEAAYSNLSSYYLVCDRANGVMTVYTNSSMTIPIKTIRVSVGNPVTLTPLGTYTLKQAGRWQVLMGPSYGQYGTHVTGGIYVHSIACTYANSYNLPTAEYLKLGSPASHGCIRCCVADAKWVWEHCSGSKIKIIAGTYVSQEGLKGPLGRNPITPLRGSKNFDPTDPACS